MRVHYIQHVAFEGLSSIEEVLKASGHVLSCTRLYNNETLPSVSEIDWLIVMGGPMGVFDEAAYPWLRAEKAFILEAIKANKLVLGICLGAQLIANVLGAKVYKNAYREIGWFNIEKLPDANNTCLSEAIPESVEVFHWHGDTFDIPEGAIPLVKSEACLNQGFIYADRVVGFQFHLETTMKSAADLIVNCGDELDGGKYVQTESQLLSSPGRFRIINEVMCAVLKALEEVHDQQ